MQNSPSPRIRILTVDDHPVLREGLAAIIGSRPDLELVAEADSGKTAIELFDRHRPDIVLVDLKLPDIHGVEVIKAIRQIEGAARVIVLTTYMGDIQALQALKAGACGYLSKAGLRRNLVESIRAVYAGERIVESEVAKDMAEHAGHDILTNREVEILKLIAGGCSNKVVAHRLQISEDTVKGHVRNVLHKLKANDRTHAVTLALHRGFIEV